MLGGRRGAEHPDPETIGGDTLAHSAPEALCSSGPSLHSHTCVMFPQESKFRKADKPCPKPILSTPPPRQHASPLTWLESDQTPRERFLELESEGTEKPHHTGPSWKWHVTAGGGAAP